MRAGGGGVPDPAAPGSELEAYAIAIRDLLERMAARRPTPPGVTVEAVDTGVPSEWVAHAHARAADCAVLYLHGGAYVLGSPRTHRGLAAAISRSARAGVLLPEYRLAPEHAFPAALEDARTAYRWLIEERGIAPVRIAISGDSAGGGLGVALLVSLREEGVPLPACYVGISPWTDLAGTGPSMDALDETDPWLDAAMVRRAAEAYAGELPRDDPRISPLYADLTGLPPMLVHVGSDEILLDDARRLVARARDAGVDASVGVFPGLWHVFHAFPGFPESRDAVREIGAFIRRHTGGVPTSAAEATRAA